MLSKPFVAVFSYNVISPISNGFRHKDEVEDKRCGLPEVSRYSQNSSGAKIDSIVLNQNNTVFFNSVNVKCFEDVL